MHSSLSCKAVCDQEESFPSLEELASRTWLALTLISFFFCMDFLVLLFDGILVVGG